MLLSILFQTLELDLPSLCENQVEVRTDTAIANTLCGRSTPAYVSKIIALHFVSTSQARKGFFFHYTGEVAFEVYFSSYIFSTQKAVP